MFMKICIIDDNPSMTSLFSKALKLNGHECVTKNDGRSGLKLLENKTLSYEPRVLSESEYSYQIERHALYFWLWMAAAPFVLLGVKTFRDLLEGK